MVKHRSEQHRRTWRKNATLLAILFGLVGLFYVITIVRMGAQ